MRNAILRFCALAALLAFYGCNVVALGGPNAITRPTVQSQFAATIVQPTPPVILGPSAPIFIIVEVPVNGVLLPGNQFFSAFSNANPNLQLACPSVITVGAGQLSTFGGAGTPAISLPITPAAPGSCNVPFNLGQNGIVTFPISVPTPH